MAEITMFVDYDVADEQPNGLKSTQERIIDFGQSGQGVSAGDVVNIFKVKKGMMVEDVDYRIITPEDGAVAGTVGDGDDVDGYDADVDCDAVANYTAHSLPGTDAYATKKKYYPNADTIDFIPDGDLDTLVIAFTMTYKICSKLTSRVLQN